MSGIDSVIVCQGQRLAFYNQSATAEFWSDYWENFGISRQTLTAGIGRRLEPVFLRHLPNKTAHILEGGCGRGQIVYRLRQLGYANVVGVDFAEETLEQIKALEPELPVVYGDITHLDWPDGYFDAYISIGVIEHFVEGPQQALCREMHRVLNKTSGVVLCSVPWYNPLRRLKATFGCYASDPGKDVEFYQYLYREDEN